MGEMNKFPEGHKLWKLDQDAIGNLSRAFSTKEHGIVA